MFITFEGMDGSGKTTQLARLAERLVGSGVDVLRTKEPDGGLLGPDVRSILVGERSRPLSPLEEMLLVAAARCDHVRSVIRPALAAGRWVLCDRFVDSTFAYQVFETDVPSSLFEAVSDACMGELRPDLTIVLDVDPEIARDRLAGRATARADPAESHRDFVRIHLGLRRAASDSPERCRLVDASGSTDEVAERVWALIHLR